MTTLKKGAALSDNDVDHEIESRRLL